MSKFTEAENKKSFFIPIMKRTFAVLLALLLALIACSCSGGESSSADVDTEATEQGSASQAMPTVLDPTEYLLYQNIFFSGAGADYEGTRVTKKGTFATVYDAFNKTKRYYVWGYNDQTKCCDWQWELRLEDEADAVSNGSLVEVSGIFTKSESSLDGYWIEQPDITVTEDYEGIRADIEMTAMSATLERVQILNIQNFPEEFEGKSVSAYGRMYSLTSIQHPYYDGVWTQEFLSESPALAIGTMVVLTGTVQNGAFADCTVEQTTQY